ncbi:MAG: hypothetical protein U0175_33280, partial [Caldilineaceae bacterium]
GNVNLPVPAVMEMPLCALPTDLRERIERIYRISTAKYKNYLYTKSVPIANYGSGFCMVQLGSNWASST